MATPISPTYLYHRLPPDTIRLLKLYQGSGNEEVSCSLELANISNPPRYEALSYCWGDAKDRTLVICNGIPCSITKSLYSALVRLRLPDRPRIVWADALCINQDDNTERSAQVLIMQDIFKRATKVNIWLGGPVEIDGKDLWPIPHLKEPARRNIKRRELPILQSIKDLAYIGDWGRNGDLNNKRWNAVITSLITLLQRPWFSRTWIIQEVAFACEVVVLCGLHTEPWEDFHRIVSYAVDLDYFSGTTLETAIALKKIEHMRRDLQRGHLQRPVDLFGSFRTFRASDSRDKIFGLHNLFNAPELGIVRLKPDYDMDVDELYTRTAIECIASDNNLDILSFAGRSIMERDGLSLPSWVPDWTKQENTVPLLPSFLENRALNNRTWPASWKSATGDSQPVFEFSQDLKVLSLRGCVFDRITEVGGVLTKSTYDGLHTEDLMDPDLEDELFTLQRWEELCGVPENIMYCTGESASDVFWKTLHAGSLPYGNEEETKPAFDKWYRPIKFVIRRRGSFREEQSYVLGEEFQASVTATVRMYAIARMYGEAVGHGLKFAKTILSSYWKGQTGQSRISALNRTPFKTKNGYIGMAAGHLEEDDQLALFSGAKVPFVLRRGTVEGTWCLVSDAYVHGIMNGELYDKLDFETLKLS